MGGALRAGMDALFLAVKHAHLAAGRFGRKVLARYGLTPARFDLLVAIGSWGTSQRELRDALGVARSTVSELVAAVVDGGLVRRMRRLCDRRTWSLQLTERGRELLERAYEECINRGLVPLSIDRMLADGGEPDVAASRFTLIQSLRGICSAFGRLPERDLYPWHPEDYIGALTEPGGLEGEVPFVA